jgi:hypothetical protein
LSDRLSKVEATSAASATAAGASSWPTLDDDIPKAADQPTVHGSVSPAPAEASAAKAEVLINIETSAAAKN